MRSTSIIRTPAAIRRTSRSWSPSATCARFRRTRSPKARAPGWRCRRLTRKRATCSTFIAQRRAMSAGSKERGFTYIGLMIVVAIMGAGLAAFGQIASHAAQREKEAELIFRGDQYRAAIASYYKKEQRYPKALADLVEDKRYPMPVRHLRRLYDDPMTAKADWGLVEAPDGAGVMGVYSKADTAPI